jgi:hypothetical protein
MYGGNSTRALSSTATQTVRVAFSVHSSQLDTFVTHLSLNDLTAGRCVACF